MLEAADPLSAPPASAVGTVRGARSLAALFLAISFLVSLCFLSVRNTYDDENSTLAYVDYSVGQIIHIANTRDVHPPGMYLLGHFAYEAIPSPRWMTLFPLLVFYAGLAIFVFSMTPLLTSTRARVCFLLLATLHPQLLMWGNTIRWYSWWTGVALISIVFALQPERGAAKARLTHARSAALGLLLVCLFYINYITLVFIAALGPAMLVRYTLRAWKQYLVTLAVFVPLISPQMHAFLFVHRVGGGDQRAGLPLSLARLVEATFCSEAYLPWHPLAMAAATVFLFLAVAGVWQAVRLLRTGAASAALRGKDNALASEIVFSLGFFAAVALSGLGIKPRNGLLLLPALAPVMALLVETVRPALAQSALIGFLALWSGVGVEHLLRRTGLAKASMINRPEEVIKFLRDTQGQDCSVVVSYDALVTLTVSNSQLPRTLNLTPFQSPVYKRGQSFDPARCVGMDLYLVKSYTGGFGRLGEVVTQEMDSLARGLPRPWVTHDFSFDPDAARKRRLSFIGGASDLPDYRYIVQSTRIPPASLETIRGKLPHFSEADGRSTPAEDFSAPAEP